MADDLVAEARAAAAGRWQDYTAAGNAALLTRLADALAESQERVRELEAAVRRFKDSLPAFRHWTKTENDLLAALPDRVVAPTYPDDHEGAEARDG